MSSRSVDHLSASLLRPDELAFLPTLAASQQPIIVTRAELQAPGPMIVAASRAMSQLTGYETHELIGRTPRIFQGPLTDRAELNRMRNACQRGERFVGQAVNYRKDGAAYLMSWTVDPIRNREGRLTHFVSVQRDITTEHPYASAWLAAERRVLAAQATIGSQLAAIAEAILVLEKTKRSFRSKELGALRQRLLELDRRAETSGAGDRS